MIRQINLFDTGAAATIDNGAASDQQAPGSHTASVNASPHSVRFYPDFFSWLLAANQCLKSATPPNDVWWVEDCSALPVPAKMAGAGPSGFTDDARAASCHSSEDRWALLYRILWRINHGEPQLLELSGDTEVALMRKYSKAVARDVHKMKAFVRFRKVEGDVPRYVSWFEPQHFIVEYVAPFFKRRFANMQWSILTPVGCAHWEGPADSQKDRAGELWFSEAIEQKVELAGDQFEQAWRIYYKSIFNPARLKITAMQSEMPKKYWKNLPEAQEIGGLISAAEERTRNMIDQRKNEDKLHCGARPAPPRQLVHQQLQNTALSPLEALALNASLCCGCPQSNAATQTVFGVGPEDARIMIIGEQPGDQEDLQGVPLTGPAGQVLSAALKHAGINREECYLTNAVKHFGFEPRGKRRLHKRPEASVVATCGHWLQQELQVVDPDIVIYLGTTAASTRFGPQVRVHTARGKLISLDNRQHLVTAHPSSILRLSRGPAQQSAYVKFIDDLKVCAAFMDDSASHSRYTD